jgi:hypothetical protein
MRPWLSLVEEKATGIFNRLRGSARMYWQARYFQADQAASDFEDLPGTEAKTCPGIVSYAPFEFEERQNISETQI